MGVDTDGGVDMEQHQLIDRSRCGCTTTCSPHRIFAHLSFKPKSSAHVDLMVATPNSATEHPNKWPVASGHIDDRWKVRPMHRCRVTHKKCTWQGLT